MKPQLFIVLALLVFACESPKQPPSPEVLLQTDRAFSDLSKEMGRNHAFLEYMAEEGVMMRPNSLPVARDLAETSLFNIPDDSYTLTWEPMESDIAASGDLGYTWGVWTLATDSVEQKGTYVTIWKKQEDGSWKFVLDGGNEGLGEE